MLDGNFSQDFDGKYNLLLLNVSIMLLYTGYVIYGHTSDYVTIQYLHQIQKYLVQLMGKNEGFYPLNVSGTKYKLRGF